MAIANDLAEQVQDALAKVLTDAYIYLDEGEIEVQGVKTFAEIVTPTGATALVAKGLALELSDGSQVHLTIQAFAAPVAAKDGFEAYKQRVLADLPLRKFIEFND